MTVPKPEAYDFGDIVAEVIAFCADTGIHPMHAHRDTWRDWPKRQIPCNAANAHGWGKIKQAASRQFAPADPLPPGQYVKGISTLTDAEGNVKLQWTKTAEEKFTREQILERILSTLPEKIPARATESPPIPKHLDTHLLTAYIMGDPHLGMLAWGEESGEDFDLKIATATLLGGVRHLVHGARPTTRAMLVNVGDFFHADDSTARTAKSGNKLDVDSRWAKVLRAGVQTMFGAVEIALEKHDEVVVVNQSGNHDDHSAFFLSVAMDAYFSGEPRVTIDMSPSRFHYFKFGKNLIGVTHGDARGASKPEDLESIMANDEAVAWGQTTYRCWWTGHVHHRRATDVRGASCESFRTLAPGDAWHAGEGYRSRNEMTAITLHEDGGEVARAAVSSALLRKAMQ